MLLSDTHMKHEEIPLPKGDIIIHAGDSLSSGITIELHEFLKWYQHTPYPTKILVAGNHDWVFQTTPDLAKRLCIVGGITYLEDSSITLNGIKIYGSPWQSEFGGWAFNLPRGELLKDKWDLIPEDIDILITHGPPFGVLDTLDFRGNLGCEDLTIAVNKIKPKLHVFGHIHSGYGHIERNETNFVNAANLNERYEYWPGQRPIVVTYDFESNKVIKVE